MVARNFGDDVRITKDEPCPKCGNEELKFGRWLKWCPKIGCKWVGPL